MIKFKWQPDDDGTGELFVKASSKGFTGKGKAWFDQIGLTKDAEKFSQYPLPKENPPIISGGFWDSKITTEIEQEHLFISAYPIGSRGQIGIQVRLATEIWQDDRVESQHKVQLEIETTYEEMRLFPEKMKELLDGKISELIIANSN